MRKNITIAILGLAVLMTTGCANGPIHRFFKGSQCNACKPAMGNTVWDDDVDSPCANGNCPNMGGDTIVPGESDVIYGQPSFDPFSGGQIVNPPSSTGVLPGPRN